MCPVRPAPPRRSSPRDRRRRRTTSPLAVAAVALGVGASAVLGAACGSSGTDDQAGISAVDAAATPGTAGGEAAVYFTLDNPGGERRLVAVAVGSAGSASLHRTDIAPNGLTTMSAVDEVVVPSGEHVVFEPGGLHVMAERLERDWAPGDTVEVELTFDDGGELDLDVPVVDHADVGGGGHGHDGH